MNNQMTEQRARKILGEWVKRNNSLWGNGKHVHWEHHESLPGMGRISLKGQFKPDELEAIAWWMRNKANI